MLEHDVIWACCHGGAGIGLTNLGAQKLPSHTILDIAIYV